jgi:hypothetical protein
MRLTEGQRKLTVVCLVTVLVLVLLSFVEPGYHQICADKKYPRPEDCALYNAVAYFFIRIFGVLNVMSAALTAIATVGIGIFTWTLWRSNERSSEHFRVTERAYVKMSHVSKMRTGLQWDKEPDSGKFTVLIEVKNCGRTPARVTAVWLTCKAVLKGQEFPVTFSYADGSLSYDSGEGYSFVMPSDAIYVPHELSIQDADRRAADDGSATLIVFGYVDYIDQFEVRHRAGYGRQYIPNVAGNNLGFPNVKAKLNYDDVREPGVGWD